MENYIPSLAIKGVPASLLLTLSTSTHILSYFDKFGEVFKTMAILSKATQRFWTDNLKALSNALNRERKVLEYTNNFDKDFSDYLLTTQKYAIFKLKITLKSQEAFENFIIFLENVEKPYLIQFDQVQWSVEEDIIDCYKNAYSKMKDLQLDATVFQNDLLKKDADGFTVLSRTQELLPYLHSLTGDPPIEWDFLLKVHVLKMLSFNNLMFKERMLDIGIPVHQINITYNVMKRFVGSNKDFSDKIKNSVKEIKITQINNKRSTYSSLVSRIKSFLALLPRGNKLEIELNELNENSIEIVTDLLTNRLNSEISPAIKLSVTLGTLMHKYNYEVRKSGFFMYVKQQQIIVMKAKMMKYGYNEKDVRPANTQHKIFTKLHFMEGESIELVPDKAFESVLLKAIYLRFTLKTQAGKDLFVFIERKLYNTALETYPSPYHLRFGKDERYKELKLKDGEDIYITHKLPGYYPPSYSDTMTILVNDHDRKSYFYCLKAYLKQLPKDQKCNLKIENTVYPRKALLGVLESMLHLKVVSLTISGLEFSYKRLFKLDELK